MLVDRVCAEPPELAGSSGGSETARCSGAHMCALKGSSVSVADESVNFKKALLQVRGKEVLADGVVIAVARDEVIAAVIADRVSGVYDIDEAAEYCGMVSATIRYHIYQSRMLAADGSVGMNNFFFRRTLDRFMRERRSPGRPGDEVELKAVVTTGNQALNRTTVRSAIVGKTSNSPRG